MAGLGAGIDQRLAVYGTLAPGRKNEHILAPLEGTWHPGRIRAHLHDEGWGATFGFPGARLDPAADEVEVLLFVSDRLDPREWARLDEFEGPEYARVQVDVTLRTGERVPAWIYVVAASSG